MLIKSMLQYHTWLVEQRENSMTAVWLVVNALVHILQVPSMCVKHRKISPFMLFIDMLSGYGSYYEPGPLSLQNVRGPH